VRGSVPVVTASATAPFSVRNQCRTVRASASDSTVTSAPALGRAVATQILGADPLSGFVPTRFDGDESIALPVGVSE
jgi:hypothetical protein